MFCFPTISPIVLYNNTFVLCSLYDIPRICLYDFVSKAIILLSGYSVNVHVSHPYSIIERTSDFYRSICVWMDILLLFHILVFNLTNADVAVAILIFISDSLHLPSLVKVTSKYLNLSTVSSIFPPVVISLGSYN